MLASDVTDDTVSTAKKGEAAVAVAVPVPVFVVRKHERSPRWRRVGWRQDERNNRCLSAVIEAHSTSGVTMVSSITASSTTTTTTTTNPTMTKVFATRALLLALTCSSVDGLATINRRNVLGWIGSSGAAAAAVVGGAPQPGFAVAGADARPDSFDVNDFLSSGSVSMPMGVSGQAGKSRPETGVVLR